MKSLASAPSFRVKLNPAARNHCCFCRTKTSKRRAIEQRCKYLLKAKRCNLLNRNLIDLSWSCLSQCSDLIRLWCDKICSPELPVAHSKLPVIYVACGHRRISGRRFSPPETCYTLWRWHLGTPNKRLLQYVQNSKRLHIKAWISLSVHSLVKYHLLVILVLVNAPL